MAILPIDKIKPCPGQIKAQPASHAKRRRLQINMIAEMVSPGCDISEEELLQQQPPSSKRPRLEGPDDKLLELGELDYTSDEPLKPSKLFESSKRLVQVPDGPLLEIPWNVKRWRHFHDGYKYTLNFDLTSGALERVKRTRLVYAHHAE
ncbi:hypothetical protein QAD02_006101 [Eretmocerus hayati]|uniref:Uncharacterized protein n=1 Tax=Eretmocerus hayati TaxID=131215 RepID=A0ACC2N0B7_9HYME|nr:hypothetical protein QAD02_006101 [Eretmocerus hayati]